MTANISEKEKLTAAMNQHTASPTPLSASEEQRERPKEVVLLREMGSEDGGQDDKHSSETGIEGTTKISSIALCWPSLLRVQLEWTNSTPSHLLLQIDPCPEWWGKSPFGAT